MEEMRGVDRLTTFQVHIARVFFGLKASDGYVVAGGAALLASELIDRPTQDLDLFASAPVTGVRPAKLGSHSRAAGARWSQAPCLVR
jgi:hypothetical protein